MQQKQKLPVDDYLSEILKIDVQSSSMIISASPGAGKTTRVPICLSEGKDKQVWVLEPRRIAAISAASRIAEENGWALGEEVGYQVRFEQKFSPQTKILFLTEALLLRKLKTDADLKGVGIVILDEFHERSVHVDLALSALKELQQLSRPDLKIVVMSATLQTQPLSDFLEKAPVLQIPGRLFPVDIRFEEKPMLIRTSFDWIERMTRLLLKALRENGEGDILCFLPGRGEIGRLKEALSPLLKEKVQVFGLHGQMSLYEQKEALSINPAFRKVILATNIAESSLTIESVRVVVDSGLVRILQQDARTGFESLVLSKISKASATQRAGRAARTGPGVVYRAWTRQEDNLLKEFESPEIERVDLTETLLLLAGLGITEPESFSWYQKPPARSLQLAKLFLQTIEAFDERGRLTTEGEKLLNFPLHPRLAKLLILGSERGQKEFACEIAALLAEGSKVSLSREKTIENDIFARWEQWKDKRSPSVLQAVQQLLRLLNKTPSNKSLSETEQEEFLRELLFDVYKDRLCRRRQPHALEAKMVGGRGVLLNNQTSVKTSEYFLAIEVTEGRESSQALVFAAVGLKEDFVQQRLLNQAVTVSSLDWDEDSQKFWSLQTKEWQGLALGPETRRPATAEEIKEKLVDVVEQRWDQILQKNEELEQWFARLEFLHQKKAEIPLLEKKQIRMALEMACFGETSIVQVINKSLTSFFSSQLDPEHRRVLDKDCPSHWQVPTGNRLRIRYTKEQGPLVEVRLQELFGLAQAPEIAGQPLTLFLLAPNYRPVQVTRDLSSFWKNGYPEVRKEMRARYPKHSWPEDPLTAPPQAKGRPR